MQFKVTIVLCFTVGFLWSREDNIPSMETYENYSSNELIEKILFPLDFIPLDSVKYLLETYHSDFEQSKSDNYKSCIYAAYSKIHDLSREIPIADSLLNLSFNLANDEKLRAYLTLEKFYYASRRGNTSSTYYGLIREAEKLIGPDTSSILIARLHNSYGVYYLGKNEPLKALNHLLTAKNSSTNEEYAQRINNNLSIVYQITNYYPKALEITHEMLEYGKRTNDHLRILYGLFGLCFMNYQMENFDEVKKAGYEAIELKKKHNIKIAFGYIYYNLGLAHLETNQLDSAYYYFQKGIALSEQQYENKELAENHFGMSLYYLKKNNPKEALKHTSLADSLYNFQETEFHQKISEVYAINGLYSKAYNILSDHFIHELEKEENNVRFKITSSLLNEKFEKEKNIEQIKFQQKLKNQQFLGIIILGSIGIVILVVFLFQKNKTNKELKTLNKQLNQRNDALKQFAYIASHDLKEPIRTMASFSGLLKRELENKANSQKEIDYLNFINKNSKTLYELVESLKIFTDISTQEIDKQFCDIQEVFDHISTQFEPLITNRNGQLRFHKPNHLKFIQFSKPMMILLLQHLIDNGFAHNPKKEPIVEVSINKYSKNILIKVSDNGPGIEPDYYYNVFKPFKTLKNKTTQESAGLGLSICKTILDNTGGKIWIEPNKTSMGTSFFISL